MEKNAGRYNEKCILKKTRLCHLFLFMTYKSISAQCCISYWNQLFNLHRESNDWFIYEMRHWAKIG